MIEGDDKLIQQHVTTSKCVWKNLTCQPREQKYGWLIWNRVPHDDSLFHSMGKFQVHQSGNFIMVSELGIGGSIIKKDNKLLLLDNAYILKIIDNGTTVRNVSQFSTFARNFAKSTKASVQRELMEGEITENS